MNKVITISREFGSGGRELGRRLAEHLGMAYYDQEIISEIARRTDLAEHYVEQIVEQKRLVPFPIHVGRSFYPIQNPAFQMQQKILLEQHKLICEMAEKSDCVVVGRCADDILREHKPFRIFVYADLDSKITRCREKATDDTPLEDQELRRQIAAVDRKRAAYYRDYTGLQWGERKNYDLCINTTDALIKELVPALAQLFCAIKA